MLTVPSNMDQHAGMNQPSATETNLILMLCSSIPHADT